MSTPPEEIIKKLDRRISSLEKQVQGIIKDLMAIQERIDHPRKPGVDYTTTQTPPHRQRR